MIRQPGSSAHKETKSFELNTKLSLRTRSVAKCAGDLVLCQPNNYRTIANTALKTFPSAAMAANRL
jgi:hypothetical protein